MSNVALNVAKKFNGEPKFEILGGVQFMSPPPSTPHSDFSGNSFSMMKNHFKGTKCRVFMKHELFLSDDDWVRPDVMVICDPEKIKYEGVFGAPDLIIEVLSPSTSKRDRGYKFNLYEKHGVTEYWMADTKNRTITVYMLETDDGKYFLHNEYYIPEEHELKRMSDKEKAEVVYEFKTHLSDDLIVDIREVFENV